MSEGKGERVNLFRTACMVIGLLSAIATILVVAGVGYGLMTKQFTLPQLENAPLLYALAMVLFTPIAFLLMFWISPYNQTAWDFMFMMGSLCLFLFTYSIITFLIFIIPSLLIEAHMTLFQLIWKGLFWMILFALPAITLPLPIARAAHKEKHLLPSGGSLFEDPTPLAFSAAGVASVYMFFKTLGLSIFFSFIVSFPVLFLSILCLLTLVVYTYINPNGIIWLMIFITSSGIVLYLTRVYGI